MSIFDFMFRDEEAVDLRELHGKARQYMLWADNEQFGLFLARLDAEAARPLKIGEQTALVEGAVRANTLREVASWLRRDLKQAQTDAATYERELKNG